MMQPPSSNQLTVRWKPTDPNRTEKRYTSSECKPDQGCEWTVPMEFQLQPNAAEGSVEVEWKVTAEASAEGTTTLPKGFTVQVSEQ